MADHCYFSLLSLKMQELNISENQTATLYFTQFSLESLVCLKNAPYFPKQNMRNNVGIKHWICFEIQSHVAWVELSRELFTLHSCGNSSNPLWVTVAFTSSVSLTAKYPNLNPSTPHDFRWAFKFDIYGRLLYMSDFLNCNVPQCCHCEQLKANHRSAVVLLLTFSNYTTKEGI